MSRYLKDDSSNYLNNGSYCNQDAVDSTMKRLSQKINDMSKSQQNNYRIS
jgi:hypothetical protein